MKPGLVIYSNDAETVWNAFRFGKHAIKNHRDEVQIFLLGKGVKPNRSTMKSSKSPSR